MSYIAHAQDLHARFQPLLLFFVDGANFINAEEPEWDLLLAVRSHGGIPTVVRPGQAQAHLCVQDELASMLCPGQLGA